MPIIPFFLALYILHISNIAVPYDDLISHACSIEGQNYSYKMTYLTRDAFTSFISIDGTELFHRNPPIRIYMVLIWKGHIEGKGHTNPTASQDLELFLPISLYFPLITSAQCESTAIDVYCLQPLGNRQDDGKRYLKHSKGSAFAMGNVRHLRHKLGKVYGKLFKKKKSTYASMDNISLCAWKELAMGPY